jgi:hypothetical protein
MLNVQDPDADCIRVMTQLYNIEVKSSKKSAEEEYKVQEYPRVRATKPG